MNRARPSSRSPTLFTLIELLVVIAIIAILAAMLLPSLDKAREQGRRSVCLGNIKQITVASIAYMDDSGGYICSYYTGASRANCVQYSFWTPPRFGMACLLDNAYLTGGANLYCPAQLFLNRAWDATYWDPSSFKNNYGKINTGVYTSYTWNYDWLGGHPGSTYKIPPTWDGSYALFADAWKDYDPASAPGATTAPMYHMQKGLNIAYLDGSAKWAAMPNSASYVVNFMRWGNSTSDGGGGWMCTFWTWMKDQYRAK
jgi:prepilin-type N-terminal cleavage/methylation domain-containing protein/prepilin-type processing-associated H-X9-DG protein